MFIAVILRWKLSLTQRDQKLKIGGSIGKASIVKSWILLWFLQINRYMLCLWLLFMMRTLYMLIFLTWSLYVLFVVAYICFVCCLVWVSGSNLPLSVTLYMMVNKILFCWHLNCSVWAELASSHLYPFLMEFFFQGFPLKEMPVFISVRSYWPR